ncbi:hypothetical protein, unlikely [Trypanosoma brucei brucei TREU927]|uniref:Uncharacterized protein n=1 Tax=Trypanosoma brucei brucei (strain 927/4 GUTat10.1) TaxID=185431 RepID=Q4GY94_TRYB2|nr:hypothetical protein, unlikely [Trypanosoma brucei brucei TREU927]CAJ16691.1 hypothetical protein, unlikely [Trypanosoma brucei brucei TREU927]
MLICEMSHGGKEKKRKHKQRWSLKESAVFFFFCGCSSKEINWWRRRRLTICFATVAALRVVAASQLHSSRTR